MSAPSVTALPGTAHRLVVGALEAYGSQKSKDGKSWTCPGHPDKHPSLDVKQGREGAVIYCRAGCRTEDVINALGLKMADLFDNPLRKERSAPRSVKPNGSANAGPAKRIEEYVYETASGDVLGKKVRWEPGFNGEPKTFTWERADGGKCDGDGNPGILYAMPLVSEAEVIHLCEGEKAADRLNAYFATHGPADHAATCPPTGKWEPSYTDDLRKKSVVQWVDRDEPGEDKAQKIYAELAAADIPVQPVQARVPTAKADAFDHLEAGFKPDDGQPFEIQLDAEMRDRVEYAARFREDRTSIEFIFDTQPKERDFLVNGFMPAHESGLLIARGGTGKGYLQLDLAVSLALGEPFGPFDVEKQRGVVLVSVEDDREEFHRRITAALDLRYSGESPSWRTDLRAELVKHIRYVDLRGITNPHLGHELRDQIARTVERVADPGLVLIDPLGRFAPAGIQINSQEGAALIVNELDAIRQLTGAFTLTAYHVTKSAIKEGGELSGGASSGSLQLEDLSRWVLNLKTLNPKEASGFGLDTQGHHYVQAAVTKTNYTPPLSDPLVFERGEGGALFHVKARNKEDLAAEHAQAALLKAGTWLTVEAWDAELKERYEMSVNTAKEARGYLKRAGRIEQREVRESVRHKLVFAPSGSIRPTGWPDPPKKLAEIAGYKE